MINFREFKNSRKFLDLFSWKGTSKSFARINLHSQKNCEWKKHTSKI